MDDPTITPKRRMTDEERHAAFIRDMEQVGQKATPEPETVSPVKWKVQDGRVFERTGEKRHVQPGDWHWCKATEPAPELVSAFRSDGEDRPCRNCQEPIDQHIKVPAWTDVQVPIILYCPTTPPHVCPIWKLSEDQQWEPPSIDLNDPTLGPVDQLIRRVEAVTKEAMQSEDVPLIARVQTLGVLYQAQALEGIRANLFLQFTGDMSARMCAALDRLAAALELRNERTNPKTIPLACCGSNRPDQHFPDCPLLKAESRAVCSMCNHGEHASCTRPTKNDLGTGFKQCECPICHQLPAIGGQIVHRFEGMTDNHFCTRCGAGRLHRIHQ